MQCLNRSSLPFTFSAEDEEVPVGEVGGRSRQVPPTGYFESLFILFTFSEEDEEVPVGEVWGKLGCCQHPN